MVNTPVWQAATLGQPTLAAHPNQFIGTHVVQPQYTAVQTAAVNTVGATSTSSSGTWLAESFTTAVGQTSIGYVITSLRSNTTSGTVLSPTTLSLYANSAGAPTGSPLATVTVTTEYAFNAVLSTLQPYPLPVTGLTASTTYWLVSPAAGNATNHYSWFRSAAVSGASTSPNGTTWTAQAYGFQYEVFDQTPSGQLTTTWEDSGARWTVFTYNGSGLPATFAEYTAGQTSSGYLQSVRSFTYSGSALTGIV